MMMMMLMMMWSLLFCFCSSTDCCAQCRQFFVLSRFRCGCLFFFFFICFCLCVMIYVDFCLFYFYFILFFTYICSCVLDKQCFLLVGFFIPLCASFMFVSRCVDDDEICASQNRQSFVMFIWFGAKPLPPLNRNVSNNSPALNRTVHLHIFCYRHSLLSS